MFSDSKVFDEEDENLMIITLPSETDDGQMSCVMRTLCLEKKDENLFSEHYKVFLFEFDEKQKLSLTDEFDAKFMGGQPTEYAKNLGSVGIFGAFLNKNIKNLEEKIKFVKKLFYAY